MAVKLRRTINSASLPTALELGTQQAGGITIDNYSGYWLQIGTFQLFVPPYTIGWASSFDGTVAGSILIRKSQPTLISTNPQTGQDDTVIATLYEETLAPNPGIVLTSKPVQTAFGAGDDLAGTTLITAMKAGSRILNAALSCIMSGAGGTPFLFLRASDSSGGALADLLSLAVTNINAVSVSLPLNTIPQQLQPNDASWFIELIRSGGGANTFHWAATVSWQE